MLYCTLGSHKMKSTKYMLLTVWSSLSNINRSWLTLEDWQGVVDNLLVDTTLSLHVGPSCIAAGFRGCCDPAVSTDCHGSDGLCYCDQGCYYAGDCCPDILQANCSSGEIVWCWVFLPSIIVRKKLLQQFVCKILFTFSSSSYYVRVVEKHLKWIVLPVSLWAGNLHLKHHSNISIRYGSLLSWPRQWRMHGLWLSTCSL